MREITRTIYIADDGTEYTTKEDCIRHTVYAEKYAVLYDIVDPVFRENYSEDVTTDLVVTALLDQINVISDLFKPK